MKFLPIISEILDSDALGTIRLQLGNIDFVATSHFPQKIDGSPPCEYFFQLYVKQSVDTVPGPEHLASTVLRDLVSDTIDLMDVNRVDAARLLIDLEAYLPQGIFVLRGTPLDKIEGPVTWKAEDVAVEAIFSRLFALPRAPHKTVYYHALLTEMCKLVPKAIASTFGRAIRTIYKNLEYMECELEVRFWDWLSHHLSNFSFKWKWEEWATDLSLPPLHPRLVCIKETIEKEMRLSYYQRVRATLPEEYLVLLSEEAPVANFLYKLPTAKLHEEAEELMRLLRSKGDSTIIDSLLAKVQVSPGKSQSGDDRESLQLLVQCVLQLGHQSFSHALNTIEHNLPLLQSRCNADSDSRRTTVNVVMKFWEQQPFVGATLLDKLLNYSVLSPLSVLQWLFWDTQPATFGKSFAWELCKTTIDKVNTRVVQVQDRWRASEMEPDSIVPEAQDAHNRLRTTWDLVQTEQKEVFVFLFTEFVGLLDRSSSDPWALHWVNGIFREVVRRYSKEIRGLKETMSNNVKLSGLDESSGGLLSQVLQ